MRAHCLDEEAGQTLGTAGFRSVERRAFQEPRPPGVTLCQGKTSSRATLALYLGETRLALVDPNRLLLLPNLRTANSNKVNKANMASKVNKASLVSRAWNRYGWMEDHNSTETIPSGTPF